MNSIFVLGIKSLAKQTIEKTFNPKLIDKINKTQLNKCSKTTKNFLSTVTSAEDEVLVTSSKKKLGIKELKKRIINIIN